MWYSLCFRSNKTRILECLRDAWAKDRRAEWSIWMVYSKVEMPHHFLNSSADDSSHHGVHKRVSNMLKLTDDVSIHKREGIQHFHITILLKVYSRPMLLLFL